MNNTRKIFITGASGFLGSSLVRSLSVPGTEVHSLTRSSKITPHHIHFDLYEPELNTSIRPDVFIHTAYVKQEKGINAFEVNVQAAKLILRFCESNHTFPVFISSLAAAEHSLSVYGRQKYAIEKMFLEAGGAAIRPGLILGNGGLFASMRDYLKTKQRIPLFGNGLQPIQTVHIDDLTEAINSIVTGRRAGLFVIAEEEPVPYQTFYETLCAELKVKPKFVRVGFRTTSFFISLASFFGMKLPIAKENLLGLKQMKHVPSQKDLDALGIKLKSWKESLAVLSK